MYIKETRISCGLNWRAAPRMAFLISATVSRKQRNRNVRKIRIDVSFGFLWVCPRRYAGEYEYLSGRPPISCPSVWQKICGTPTGDFRIRGGGMEESGYKLLPVCTRRIRASAVKCRYCGGVARKALQRASAGKPRLAGAGEVAAPAAAVRVETVPVMEDSRPELFRLSCRHIPSHPTPVATGASAESKDSAGETTLKLRNRAACSGSLQVAGAWTFAVSGLLFGELLPLV